MGKKRALDRFFGSLFHHKRSLRTNRVLEQAQFESAIPNLTFLNHAVGIRSF
jgi:hypothetical protein